MDTLWNIQWGEMFVPGFSLIEIFLRGTAVYLFVFFLLRMQRRETGDLAIADILVVVLIADAAQNAMASEYRSITEGFTLIGTIVFWDHTVAWLSYKFPWFRRITYPGPLLLIKDGRMMKHHMKKELITEAELSSKLREEGIDDIRAVKECYLEGEGHISVITKKTFAQK